MTALPVSCIYEGRVRHRRLLPKPHSFSYPVYQLFLDLDELPRLEERLGLFRHNGRGWSALFDRDYLGPGERPIREKLKDWLASRGIELGERKVFLLTHARVLGYAFNPVSYYYVFGPDGSLDLAVAEINNTFGETYGYVLERRGSEKGISTPRFPKVFHISPFLPMDLEYEFHLAVPGESLAVHVDDFENGEKVFDATITARREPLTAASLARALVRHPLMPVLVIAWIHWQALKLWMKQVPVYTRPEPPAGLIRSRRVA
ncbi:MAG: DUF1365 family protein [Thermoanaerobaculia bacterium]|nr:DUF1365 family protein [Thermoanaerobaculia bacterium]